MNQFTKLLSRISSKLFHKNPDDTEVSLSEIITRFIFDKNYFRKSDHTVRHGAFMPHKNETSVYRVTTISEGEIWAIGNEYVAKLRKRNIKARTDVVVEEVNKQHLQVVSETSKHHLHANIVGWPIEKHEQMQHATELANEASLVLP